MGSHLWVLPLPKLPLVFYMGYTRAEQKEAGTKEMAQWFIIIRTRVCMLAPPNPGIMQKKKKMPSTPA